MRARAMAEELGMKSRDSMEVVRRYSASHQRNWVIRSHAGRLSEDVAEAIRAECDGLIAEWDRMHAESVSPEMSRTLVSADRDARAKTHSSNDAEDLYALFGEWQDAKSAPDSCTEHTTESGSSRKEDSPSWPSGEEIRRVLESRGVKTLYHHNTVATALTYIEQGGLMSREAVDDGFLVQTPQRSDLMDRRLGIWGDIFLDTLNSAKIRRGADETKQRAGRPLRQRRSNVRSSAFSRTRI